MIVEVKIQTAPNRGYDAGSMEYVDIVQAGTIDPTKLEPVALQNAASIASLLLTTEALITDIPGVETCLVTGPMSQGVRSHPVPRAGRGVLHRRRIESRPPASIVILRQLQVVALAVHARATCPMPDQESSMQRTVIRKHRAPGEPDCCSQRLAPLIEHEKDATWADGVASMSPLRNTSRLTAQSGGSDSRRLSPRGRRVTNQGNRDRKSAQLKPLYRPDQAEASRSRSIVIRRQNLGRGVLASAWNPRSPGGVHGSPNDSNKARRRRQAVH